MCNLLRHRSPDPNLTPSFQNTLTYKDGMKGNGLPSWISPGYNILEDGKRRS